MNEKKFLNALLSMPGTGYETIAKLRERFDSYETAWKKRDPKQLPAAADPDRGMELLEKHGISMTLTEEPSFPRLLKEIHSPPFWLYTKGSVRPDEEVVAIVGSRKASSYGKEATERIVSGLALATSATIASGLAVGIDGAAHRAALKNGLRTIAVIGSGLDEPSLFPQEHRNLSREILASGGTIISEYPPGTPPLKHHFIQRNRLISGLAKGVLVVEAAEKSGALITVRFALEQGRSAMAVPGSIFSPYSKGTNRLIGEGALAVASAEDLIEELGLPRNIKSFPPHGNAAEGSETEKNILARLDEPRKVDELVEKLNLAPSLILSALSMLELKGLARNTGGKWIRR